MSDKWPPGAAAVAARGGARGDSATPAHAQAAATAVAALRSPSGGAAATFRRRGGATRVPRKRGVSHVLFVHRASLWCAQARSFDAPPVQSAPYSPATTHHHRSGHPFRPFFLFRRRPPAEVHYPPKKPPAPGALRLLTRLVLTTRRSAAYVHCACVSAPRLLPFGVKQPAAGPLSAFCFLNVMMVN